MTFRRALTRPSGGGVAKFIKNWIFYFMRLFQGGSLLGLAKGGKNAKQRQWPCKVMLCGQKAVVSFSVSRLSVGVNRFCIQGALDTSLLGKFDVRGKTQS